MNPDQEYVLKTIESRDVHFVRFWFTDVLGQVKSFAVNPNELESAFEEGMGFDGSRIEGFSDEFGTDCDLLAFPDASTFQVLPWRPDSNAVARMFCSIRKPNGEVHERSPRHILARVVEALSEAGFEAAIAPEIEYFYFQNAQGTELLDDGGYFDLNTLDSGSDLRRDTILTLEKMGIPVEMSHHEVSPSQHEVDLRPTGVLEAADEVQTCKMVVKEIAAAHGVYASFMPKPREDCAGSGMHVNISLFDKAENNCFFDATDSAGLNLSATAKSFIAGLLKYAPELSLLTNQYVNSYKRLAAGNDAPMCTSWGRVGRNLMVRVPGHKPNKEATRHVVLRNPDPSCNPYLAFAAILTAGLSGIQEGLELTAPMDLCLPEETPLPTNLGEALALFAKSELAHKVLGDDVFTYLLNTKRAEWQDYQQSVSTWDISRYLEVL
ncbi:MAG: glutamine synthetase [Eggerthellaceae bacterium]|nr:glutamine synthetase [Eggerthellaceae bacterium]